MAERIIPLSTTLVKYDNPVLVTKHEEKKPALAKERSGEESHTRAKSAAILTDARRETEEILNTILPPKEWEEEGQLWRQNVSTTPATRLDVINLQEQLDMRLQQQQARETGICPVRRELYTQCFDEIIRQVTINCAERGLLLLRVRDEMRMTIEAYQALYCSSIAFGMRKALQAEQGKSDLQQDVDDLKREKQELEHQIIELKQRAEQADRRAAETRLAEERKHTEEIAFLMKTNQQLKTQLEGIIAPKK
ncbi:33 kDa inner dynein arm light chain, axonemal [Tribolium castaneum]|uniref:Inner dynein arm light chain, axonemal-like Protein n=1 Tax=Tribolium castaneum TaxID=7070 RepID=D6X4F2_TRICA|nr:PREDICTED: 33 kDa inner dynein arm light chain, axonemal [Tribolium castaneum]EEZ97276.1 Putative inner dynein arm light chain, axonemal-like Protein [Tribolium castaneum]|eukprot:XP_971072.1 PREDICTED: 33 kDa inner dynein arm light chain, axonemal [Tribolium castaneum]